MKLLPTEPHRLVCSRTSSCHDSPPSPPPNIPDVDGIRLSRTVNYLNSPRSRQAAHLRNTSMSTNNGSSVSPRDSIRLLPRLEGILPCPGGWRCRRGTRDLKPGLSVGVLGATSVSARMALQLANNGCRNRCRNWPKLNSTFGTRT